MWIFCLIVAGMPSIVCFCLFGFFYGGFGCSVLARGLGGYRNMRRFNLCEGREGFLFEVDVLCMYPCFEGSGI